MAELARGRQSACVVISDVTRPVPNAVILPPLLATLEQNGIPRERIVILNATGMHRPNEGAELIEMVGQFVYDHYRIENHHGRELSEHVYLGDSPHGVPVWVDRRYAEADLKITTGLIEPHFMAGFSGGRKLICPGIAAFETIRAWHSPRFLEHSNSRNGCLIDNPVHAENTWIARHAGCDFILNTVIDAKRRILKVVAGDMEAAWRDGVEFVRELVTDTVPQPVDVVVTTGAGYPLDATYYQCVKGMVSAMSIVRRGGTIILAAGMTEGIGSPEFRKIFDDFPSLDAFMQAITRDGYFTMDQWQVEELAKASRHARIVVVSDGLPSDVLRRLFVATAPSVEQAVAEALATYGEKATLAVIPKGPYLIAETASA